jgi:O-antigen ligase
MGREGRAQGSRLTGSRQDVLIWLQRLLGWAIVATVFCLPLSESMKNAGYLVALAAYGGLIAVGGWRQMVIPPVGTLVLLSVAVAVASALGSAEPRAAWRGVWEIFRYATFFFLAARGIQDGRQAVVLLWAAAGGTGVAATAVVAKVVAHGFTIHHFTMFSLGDKNAVGQYLAMALALMLAMVDRLPLRWVGRAVLAVGGGMSLVVLALTNSRAMWGALVVAVLVLVGWRRPRIVVPGLALFLAVVAVASLAKPDVAERVGALGHAATYLEVGQRAEIWRSAARIWRDHPWLGIGPRTFSLYAGAAGNSARARYAVPKDRPHTQAHNNWLHVAAETGTLGLLAMVGWVLAIGIWLARHRGRFAGHGPLGAAWAGAVGTYVATLVASLTEPAVGHEHAMLLMGLLGVVMGSAAPWARGGGPATGSGERAAGPG